VIPNVYTVPPIEDNKVMVIYGINYSLDLQLNPLRRFWYWLINKPIVEVMAIRNSEICVSLTIRYRDRQGYKYIGEIVVTRMDSFKVVGRSLIETPIDMKTTLVGRSIEVVDNGKNMPIRNPRG